MLRRQQGFLGKFMEAAQVMLRGAVQTTSNDKYDCDWRRWVGFRQLCPDGHHEGGWYMDGYPIGDQVRIIGAYMLYAYTELKLSAGTISGSLSGIRHQFRSTYRCCQIFSHESIRGSKTALALDERKTKEDSCSAKKLPMSVDMVIDLVDHLGTSKDIRECMTAVAVQMAFFYLLRQSEYIYNKASVAKGSDHAMKAEDIIFELDTNKGRIWLESWQLKPEMWNQVRLVKFILRSAKNDTERTGSTFWSRNRQDPGGINIVKVVFDWAIRARHVKGSYFMSAQVGNSGMYLPLRYDDVSNAIKACATRFGFTTAEFGTHSPRIGGACALRAGDISNSIIMTMGRWKSLSSCLGYQGTSFREYDTVQSVMKDVKVFKSMILN